MALPALSIAIGIHMYPIITATKIILFETFTGIYDEHYEGKPNPSANERENPDKPDPSEDELDIPAYERKGVKLKS